ncbi:MAG: hypothetical protein AB7F86_08120 [Bdellovibrionales bacterium]
MKLIGWALISFLCGAIHAGAATQIVAPAQIRFISTEPYTCQILGHRIKSLSRSHRALAAVLDRLKSRKRWRAAEARRVEALLARISPFPKQYYTKTVEVSVNWKVDADWAKRMNSTEQVAVDWNFQGFRWQEPTGIMPDDIATKWNAPTEQVELKMVITPLQLCFGEPEIRLSLQPVSAPDSALELQSTVEQE